jgi:hypothetical protein
MVYPLSFYSVRFGDVLQYKYHILFKLGTTLTVWMCLTSDESKVPMVALLGRWHLSPSLMRALARLKISTAF